MSLATVMMRVGGTALLVGSASSAIWGAPQSWIDTHLVVFPVVFSLLAVVSAVAGVWAWGLATRVDRYDRGVGPFPDLF